MSLALVFWLFLAACQPHANSGSGTAYGRYDYTFFDTFDTVVQIVGYAASEQEFLLWAKQAEARFGLLHRLFDIYHTYPGINNLKTINDRAGGEAVPVAAEIIELLQLCQQGNENSAGLLDITLGPVLQIWREFRAYAEEYPDSVVLPSEAELRTAYEFSGAGLKIDAQAKTVRLLRPGMALNVGAVAKGFATELVAKELSAAGMKSFLINAGGNVRCVGQPLDGTRQRWGVGLQNPQGSSWPTAIASGDTLDAVYVRDMSVVSSGSYERYVVVEGEVYHHLIDPRTLFPGRNYQAVTVITEDSGWADLYSTAIFMMTPEEAFTFAEREGDLALLLVLPDGEVRTNAAMDRLLASKGATAY